MRRPSRRPALHRQRGFTLLELLVAITLLGLIAAMAFSGLRLGARAWEAADAREHDVYLVQQFLRARLSAAYASSELGFGLGVGAEHETPHFEGGPDHVSFVTPLADIFGVGGLYRMTAEVAEADDDGRRELVLSWRLFRPADGDADADPDERNRRVLLDGIERAEFAFFGPSEDPRGEPVWQDSWRDRTAPPSLVRLTVDRAAGTPPWPPLVVALPLAPANHYPATPRSLMMPAPAR